MRSRLVLNLRPIVATGVSAAGWLRLNLDPQQVSINEPHALLAAANDNIHRGLPVTGFAATSITNNSATQINGVWTLSNYSGTSKHRTTGNCVRVEGTTTSACE